MINERFGKFRSRENVYMDWSTSWRKWSLDSSGTLSLFSNDQSVKLTPTENTTYIFSVSVSASALWTLSTCLSSTVVALVSVSVSLDFHFTRRSVRGCRKWKRSSNLPKTSAFLLSALLSVVLEGREVLSPPPTVFSFARFYCASGFRLPFSSVVSRFTGWPREHNTNLPAPCPARKCGTSHLLSPSLN